MWYLFSHKVNLKVSKKRDFCSTKSIIWDLIEVLYLFICFICGGSFGLLRLLLGKGSIFAEYEYGEEKTIKINNKKMHTKC